MQGLVESARTAVEYKDLEHRVPYSTTKIPAIKTLRRLVHNGQLKLLLTEIQFLTKVLSYYMNPCYVVYAGSAPSHKLGTLTSLFPNAKFVLVDPAEHYIQYEACGEQLRESQYSPGRLKSQLYFKTAAGNRFNLKGRQVNLHGAGVVPRKGGALGEVGPDIAAVIIAAPQTVFIIEDFMTEAIARALAPLGAGKTPLFFISDIRTRGADSEAPSNLDILWNSAQHLNWLKELNAQHYMLKFHPPYPASEEEVARGLAEYHRRKEMHGDMERCAGLVDFVSDYANRKFVYLAGDNIFIQAFGPLNTTEVRLVGSDFRLAEYDTVEFEEKMRYYNVFHRPLGNHRDAAAYKNNSVGLDRCGDCAVACNILQGYLQKFFGKAEPPDVITLFSSALQAIGRTVFGKFNSHGVYDIHATLSGEGYNVDYVVSAMVSTYIQHTFAHTPQWEGRGGLPDALRWAELRGRVVETLKPFWAEGRPEVLKTRKGFPTAEGASRTVMNSLLMAYMFAGGGGRYEIYVKLARFIGPSEAPRLARLMEDLVNSKEYVPVLTKGFELTPDGFRTAAGGGVAFPPALRTVYTPERLAIDVLFTYGIAPQGDLWKTIRNCNIDAAIAAAAADVKQGGGAPTLVELNTTPRGYYTWRAATGERPIEGVAGYSQRCLWGGERTIDCTEKYPPGSIVLIYLFSIPAPAHGIISASVKFHNRGVYIIVINAWATLSAEGVFAKASVCGSLVGCGAEGCAERTCGAMFLKVAAPSDDGRAFIMAAKNTR